MQDAPTPSTCQSDILDPARANALAVLLGRPDRFDAGSDLPAFFHQIYFWHVAPADDLGRDGHPKTGGLIPDMGLPRRMWAGGRLSFRQVLRAGHPAEKRSSCVRAEHKTGRSGPLALITLKHEFHQSGVLCVTEWQDLVYRADPDLTQKQPTPPRAPEQGDRAKSVDFDPTMLFRYSALTFNGHRIHYDQPYARDVEGYGGLVVHGPLLAQFLMLKAWDELGPLAAFSFRATSPLFHQETASICRQGTSLWVAGPDGRQCMTAEAKSASE